MFNEVSGVDSDTQDYYRSMVAPSACSGSGTSPIDWRTLRAGMPVKSMVTRVRPKYTESVQF